MDGHMHESDGSKCFAHGLAHLIDEHGYEKGLVLAGWTLLNMLDEPGHDQGPAEEDQGGVDGKSSKDAPSRRLNLLDLGTYSAPAWGVRPSVITSSLDAPAGPIIHRDRLRGRRRQNNELSDEEKGTTMGHQTATVEVDVPVRVAYNQWTQFEEFPQFMEGVERVRQLDDTTLEWQAEIAGVERSWQSRIVEQDPDRVVAWETIRGTRNNGRVEFQPTADQRTRIDLTIDIDPEGFVEKAGDKMGIIERRAEMDLERFKEFIESRGAETGAWRGEVHDGETRDDGSQEPGIATPTDPMAESPGIASERQAGQDRY